MTDITLTEAQVLRLQDGDILVIKSDSLWDLETEHVAKFKERLSSAIGKDKRVAVMVIGTQDEVSVIHPPETATPKES